MKFATRVYNNGNNFYQSSDNNNVQTKGARGAQLPVVVFAGFSNPSMKTKVRRARCKQVLAILINRLETIELIREEIHPPIGDFAKGPLEMAVVRWNGLEVSVPLECVVFLRDQSDTWKSPANTPNVSG